MLWLVLQMDSYMAILQKSSHFCCWEQQPHCLKTSHDLPLPRDKAKKRKHGLQESNRWPHNTLPGLPAILPAPITWSPLQPRKTSSSSQNRSGSVTHSRLRICKGESLLEPMSLSYFCQRAALLWRDQLRHCMTGFPWWFSGKEASWQCRRHGFDPPSRKIPYATWQKPPQLLTLCSRAQEPHSC